SRASSVVARASDDLRQRAMQIVHGMLAGYGAEEPVPREDQPSNYLLQMDLEGYKSLAVFFPLLFLFCAALTIYTLMVRIVNSQRNQIGFLRASGVPVHVLTRHYLLYSLICGGLGSVLGVSLGLYLSWLLTRFYLQFLSIPVIASPIHWDATAFGVGIGLLSCGVAGHFSARRVARLQPAEAIREEAVEPGHKPFIERLVPRRLRQSYIWQIPFRNIFRKPRRTAYTIIGIALAMVLLLVSLGSRDASLDSIGTYLDEIMRYDLQAGFLPAQTKSIEFHVSQMPGVTGAEAALEIPVEIRRKDRVVNTVIVGLPPGSHLETLVSPGGEPVRVHDRALLMSESNRRKLGVEIGDVVHLAFARNDEDIHIEVPVHVGELIRQPVGSYVYMSATGVKRIFERDLGLPIGAITRLMVRAKPDYLKQLKERLLRIPNVAAVEESKFMRTQLEDAVEMNMSFSWAMILLGAGLALAVIYNTVTINIMERTRELASMRAQGMSRWTIAALITVENLTTGTMGLIVGLPLGIATNHAFVSSLENEIMNFQPVIYPSSFATTIISVLVVIVLSQVPGILHINRLNLAEATKLRTG
ncbi:MAG: FtsX-like permease family protein, partial [Armatimonadota bacterium]